MGDPLRLRSDGSTEQAVPGAGNALQTPQTLSSLAAPERALSAEHDPPMDSARIYRWLAVAASVLLFLAAVSLALDRRLENRLAVQRAQAFELLIRAHRLALDAQQALSPDAQAFQRLEDSGQRFAAAFAALEGAGSPVATAASLAPDDAAGMRAALRKRWNALQPTLQSLAGQRHAVQEAGMRQQALAGHTQPLTALLQKLSRAEAEERLEPGAAAALRQVEAALEPARLAYLSLALAAPSADAALAARLREQLIRTRTALAALLRERPPSAVRENAETLHEALQPVLHEVERLRELAPLLARARASAHEIANATDALAHDAAVLARSYPPLSFAVSRWMWAGVAAGVAAFGCLLWILKAMLADAERRAASSLQSAVRNRQANQRTQEAILRLLEQLSRLTQGDLTVRADAADELTGAVADAINYAVGELRRLVLGIHSAADRLAEACAEAQELSGELLNASQLEAQEISETAASVAAVSRSASEMSERVAHAARRIEAGVKAIQLETQDATSAMERSTARVVEQTQLARSAGQAFKRIDEHAHDLALLTDAISTATEALSETARCIDAAMAEVTGMNELPAEASGKRADRSAQLAALARELKQLVAGFKTS